MSLPPWILTPRRQDFFVQEKPKDPWHVESEDHCEYMLCGKWIGVELSTVRISSSWGQVKCPDCWIILERMRRTVFQ